MGKIKQFPANERRIRPIFFSKINDHDRRSDNPGRRRVRTKSFVTLIFALDQRENAGIILENAKILSELGYVQKKQTFTMKSVTKSVSTSRGCYVVCRRVQVVKFEVEFEKAQREITNVKLFSLQSTSLNRNLYCTSNKMKDPSEP